MSASHIKRLGHARWLWVGALTSYLGSAMQSLAIVFLVLDKTQSLLFTAAAAAALALPFLALSVPAGHTAERANPSTVVSVTATGAMFLSVGLGFMAHAQQLNPTTLLLCNLAVGALAAFEYPAWQMIISRVGGADETHLRARLATAWHTASLIGAVAGGVLLEAIGPSWTFMLNAVSFLPFLGIIHSLKAVVAAERDGDLTTATNPQTASAFELIRTSRALKKSLYALSVTGLLAASLLNILAGVAKEMDDSAHAFGWLTAAYLLGASAVSMAISMGLKKKGETQLLVISMVASGVAQMALSGGGVTSGATRWAMVSISLLAAGLCTATAKSLAVSTASVHAPPRQRGRVISVFGAVASVTTAAGGLILGGLADLSSVWTVSLASGATVAALGGLLAIRSYRAPVR